MKLNATAIAVGAVLFSGSVLAEFSANIGATSNYVWRGVSQTDDQAAISGGLDFAHDSGLYVGTWASNVDFGDDATAEVDLYGGFGGEAGSIGYDVGVAYYMYPGEDYNFAELYGSVSFSILTAGIHYTVYAEADDTPDNEVFIEGDVYYYLSASYEFMPTWTVGGTVGYYDFEDDGVTPIAATAPGPDTSYAHYQLDIGKSAGDFGDFTFSISSADQESGDGNTKVFASWGKTF